MIDPDVEAENLRHQQILLSDIAERRLRNDREVFSLRRDDIHTMAVNQKLLSEINALRSVTRNKPPHAPGCEELPNINGATEDIAGGVKQGAAAVVTSATSKPMFQKLPHVKKSPLPDNALSSYRAAIRQGS